MSFNHEPAPAYWRSRSSTAISAATSSGASRPRCAARSSSTASRKDSTCRRSSSRIDSSHMRLAWGWPLVLESPGPYTSSV